MLIWIKLIIWVGVTVSLGYCFIEILPGSQNLYKGEKVAVSFPVGLGLASLVLGLAFLLGLQFSIFSILFVWLTVCGTFLFQKIKMKKIGSFTFEQTTFNYTILEKFCLVSIIIQIIFNIFRSMLKPWANLDALQMYGLKAKVFYLSNTIPSDFIERFSDTIPNLQYPLLLPLSEVYFYLFQGFLNDEHVKIIFPLYHASFIVLFYFILRRFISREASFVFSFLLATIPQFAEHGVIASADIILSFYYAASVFYLFLWTKNQKQIYLLMSIVFSFFIIYTKTEGLMLLSINAVIMMSYSLLYNIKKIKIAIAFFLYSFSLVGGYVVITKLLRLNIQDAFPDFRFSHAPLQIIEHLNRLPAILHEYQMQFFGPKRWNVIWIIFFLTFILNFKKLFSRENALLSFWIILLFCGYTAIYLLTSWPVELHLSTTASRFFIHIVPIAVFHTAYMLKDSDISLFRKVSSIE